MDLRRLLTTLDRAALEQHIRNQAKTIVIGERVALTRALTKLALYVNPVDTFSAPHLMLDGFWQMWVTIALAKRVPVTTRCIDVGGGDYGYWALLLAELTGEPVSSYCQGPTSSDLIKMSAQVNGLNVRTAQRMTIWDERCPDVDCGFARVDVRRNGVAALHWVQSCPAAQVLLECGASTALRELTVELDRYHAELVTPDGNFEEVPDGHAEREALLARGATWLWLTPRAG